MRYIVERNFVLILGYIWMPNCMATMERTLSTYDIENIGEFTRENVEQWLACNAGDFQQVVDFYATVGDKEIPWANEDNEMAYNDLTFPDERMEEA